MDLVQRVLAALNGFAADYILRGGNDRRQVMVDDYLALTEAMAEWMKGFNAKVG